MCVFIEVNIMSYKIDITSNSINILFDEQTPQCGPHCIFSKGRMLPGKEEILCKPIKLGERPISNVVRKAILQTLNGFFPEQNSTKQEVKGTVYYSNLAHYEAGWYILIDKKHFYITNGVEHITTKDENREAFVVIKENKAIFTHWGDQPKNVWVVSADGDYTHFYGNYTAAKEAKQKIEKQKTEILIHGPFQVSE
jgi:hypothetical protein